MAQVLVVDDEPNLASFFAEALALDGHAVDVATDGAEAVRRLAAKGYDVVVTDLKMPGLDGMAVLRRVRAEQPEVEVVVLTAHGTVETAVEAMKLGAFDYLQKPLSGPAELRLLVGRALERRALLARQDLEAAPEGPVLGYGDPAMEPVVAAIGKVARTQATVLLLGESGTGKEVAARAVHALSERAGGPFVAVNCAALAEHLLESELFGHEKGAFTGATERRRGRIELAQGGTFFLDEIGELKPELQSKLLRVLEQRSFERLGGTRTLEADVRWVAATNRDLKEQIAAGAFREDLYHRLAVFPVRLPSLRERRRDIVPLAEVLLARAARELKRRPPRLTAAARVLLEGAPWPGNVRELANVLERACIVAEGDVLDVGDLWIEPARAGAAPAATEAPATLEELERRAILDALGAVDGNRRRAAERLGIGLRTLYDKLKRYDL